MNLYEMIGSQMFRLDGELYYFRELKGDKAVCEKEDGTVVYLPAHLTPDEYRPSSFLQAFSFVIP